MARALRDLIVSDIGLGCIGMFGFYGETDERESLRGGMAGVEL